MRKFLSSPEVLTALGLFILLGLPFLAYHAGGIAAERRHYRQLRTEHDRRESRRRAAQAKEPS